ncbi:MAG TPA: cation diffusion facilitator family transporter [Sphingomicrobium sp.]|jgi:cobalt-zinc-cadmium efflux system protein
MSAGHSHHHHHSPDYTRAFAIGILLNLGFVIVEAVFGIAANSMALLSDAGHNLSDVLGLVIAWAGAAMARRGASARFTYGLKKAPILAALFNSLFLLVAVGAILAEAVRRLFNPAPTDGTTVIIVAAVGIVINGATALLFARGRKGDINVRGAFLHMAADALVSVAVVLSGLVIVWTGQQWIDPAMSIAVAVVILWGSFGLLRESTGMSLAGVPSGIELERVEAALGELPGVETVHDLHVWPLSTTETALTAHLVAPSVASTDELLLAARKMLHDRFHIEHCTLQIESRHLEDADCC